VALWADVARRWQELGRPHRGGYARWRQAQAELWAGGRSSATVTLQSAWHLADQHVPLRAELSSLARLARIELAPDAVVAPPQRTPVVADPPSFGLTARELDVLRLLAEGLTNAQIGARLYLSSKTVSVHVTAILRKLQAVNRVHAAAIAERAGVLHARDQ
jgi:DNA-binding NarL/FixJ family response regulator